MNKILFCIVLAMFFILATVAFLYEPIDGYKFMFIFLAMFCLLLLVGISLMFTIDKHIDRTNRAIDSFHSYPEYTVKGIKNPKIK